MIRNLHLESLAGPSGAVLLALAVAAGGGLLLRGRAAWAGALAPLAVLAGWAALVPRVAGWVRPASVAEHLVVPAAVAVVVAVLRGRVGERAGRWLGAAGLLFGAWWVARAGGVQFWRAWFGVAVLGTVLGRFGERTAAGAGALWGGLALAGAPPVWSGIAAVLAAGSAGMARSGLVGAGGLLAMAVGAAELGAGRLGRGRAGIVELACVAAMVAPALAGWIEWRVANRVGKRGAWAARGAGLAGAACLGIGAAWAGARLLRG